MIRTICTTDDSIATTILRLVLGVVFFAHGAQKMLGWFGGFGFSATMAMFTGMMHMPAPLAFLAIAAEFFGGLGLILGCLTRVAAFGIGINIGFFARRLEKVYSRLTPPMPVEPGVGPIPARSHAD